MRINPAVDNRKDEMSNKGNRIRDMRKRMVDGDESDGDGETTLVERYEEVNQAQTILAVYGKNLLSRESCMPFN